MLFSYKIFTFFPSFSQLPNKFYNRKFQYIKLTKQKSIRSIHSQAELGQTEREGGRKNERLREREIDQERDGDWVNKIDLQRQRRSSMAAMRSILGGSGIIEGGFELSVSPAAWERRIGDVGGEMGFAGVREGFALVDRVHAKLEVGGGEVDWIGYDGAAHRSMEGPRTGVCV